MGLQAANADHGVVRGAESVAIGVDIGGTFTKIALVRTDGAVLRQERLQTGSRSGSEAYLAELKEVVARFARLQPSALGVGLALPGFLSDGRRSITFNPNTPALVGVDFVDLLAPLGLPLHIEQDLNVPAVAEYRLGAGRGAARLLSASIGTGLGAAVILDGELLRFTSHTVGDSGHVILDPVGPACEVGCRGCAEALASAQGVARLARQKFSDPRAARLRAAAGEDGVIPAGAVIAACAEEDPLAVEILTETGRWLGQWLACLAPIFLPDTVVLCGGVAEAGEPLRAACQARFLELAGPEYTRCTINLGVFKGLAGVVGAAAPFFYQALKGR